MARAAHVSDEQIQARLTGVFRATGYAGASLSELSSAVGLQRASLYHRFPEGKPAMAQAVLAAIETEFAEVLKPLETEPDVVEAVAEMARRVFRGYHEGRVACVLDTMTLEGSPPPVKEHAAGLARHWIAAMAAVSVRAGHEPAEGGRRAQAALVRIQGALVVARVLGEPSVFEQALAELPELLTSGGGDQSA